MLGLQQRLGDSFTSASADELAERIAAAKATLGNSVVILGHHYQRDEVIAWADARGDSLALARFAGEQREAKYVVFCGVEFMAEAADILTSSDQQVILPDLAAGCSMADMADIESVETAWEELGQVIDLDSLLPITYINSSAEIKDFVGRHGGSVCTSSNASAVLRWALGVDPSTILGPEMVEAAALQGRTVLFFPDQHLGRNTAYQMGFPTSSDVMYDPRFALGGLSDTEVKGARFILWKGHCSVHQRFTTAQIEAFRNTYPDGLVFAHPECSQDVVALADVVGSTDAIIKAVNAAPKNSVIGIATEINLVHRIANEHLDLTVKSLDPVVCPCSTMSRIDAPHLAWILEELVAGRVRNQISVDPDIANGAKVALDRMLGIV